MLISSFIFFFFKQKTAYEMRISDWSSDVCSSDLQALLHDLLDQRQVGARVDAEHLLGRAFEDAGGGALGLGEPEDVGQIVFALGIVAAEALDQREEAPGVADDDAGVAEIDLPLGAVGVGEFDDPGDARSEEPTSELES